MLQAAAEQLGEAGRLALVWVLDLEAVDHFVPSGGLPQPDLVLRCLLLVAVEGQAEGQAGGGVGFALCRVGDGRRGQMVA